MTTPHCHRTLLARSPGAEVARCTCGHIHVSVGPVTIRMDEDTLHAAWHTLGEALRSLTASPSVEPGGVAHAGAGARRVPGEWEQ